MAEDHQNFRGASRLRLVVEEYVWKRIQRELVGQKNGFENFALTEDLPNVFVKRGSESYGLLVPFCDIVGHSFGAASTFWPSYFSKLQFHLPGGGQSDKSGNRYRTYDFLYGCGCAKSVGIAGGVTLLPDLIAEARARKSSDYSGFACSDQHIDVPLSSHGCMVRSCAGGKAEELSKIMLEETGGQLHKHQASSTKLAKTVAENIIASLLPL